MAHNHEVRGSSPLPATKEEVSPIGGAFSFADIIPREAAKEEIYV